MPQEPASLENSLLAPNALNADWHAMPAEDALQRLATHRSGLSAANAAARLERFGPNRLPVSKPRGLLARLAAQINNVLIYVLLAAASVSVLIGHPVDAVVILLVVIINAAIGFIQEGRAEKALEAIKGMLTPHASVLREGRRVTIGAEQVVIGDIVLIEAGDRVPADLRLVQARNLKIDEAILTGESVPVEKNIDPGEAVIPIGDRASMAYSGTLVVAGQGLGVTVATGLGTELGRISAMLETVQTLTTPLLRKMDQFARQLTVVILAASAAVFLFAIGLRSYPAAEAFMAVVGLVVSAIPEGLPAVMTITLAIGVQKMAARNAIIRRLPAVETLGSVSVICSDKTGTLTRSEMTVQAAVIPGQLITVKGTGYEPRGAFEREGRAVSPDGLPALTELAKAAVLCNDAVLRGAKQGWLVDGDPMEGALIAFAAKAGLDADTVRGRSPRKDEIPFDSQLRFMATLHDDERGSVIYMKGASETVLARCGSQMDDDGAVAPIRHERWAETVEALAAKGYRVLALATKRVPTGMQRLDFGEVEGGLVLLGLLGLIDPPREEVIEAIAECRTAGIGIKMITGDHVVTASAIARQLGLQGYERAVSGEKLDGMDAAAFRGTVHGTTVFARATPEHKLRIVEALQADGAVIAMTGDGVNDAPALKRANVGIAMGRKGTEAAKESAEIVLADDNFASIVAAVKEGRTVYDNLEKLIGWTLPTNGGEALAIIGAILFGMALPITPLQILWINMVSSVALGMTLAFEEPELNVMRRPPRRPSDPILSNLLIWRIVVVSLLFVSGAFGIFFWALAQGRAIEEARTAVVNVIVVMEIFYLFNVRSLYQPESSWRAFLCTRAMLAGIGITIVAQLLFTYAPFMQVLFDTRAMPASEALIAVGIGITVFFALELEKYARQALMRKQVERPD